MDYPNSATATYDFFGRDVTSTFVDFPNRLQHLVSNLPPGHFYTAEKFINDNTIFPYYAPFLSYKRASQIRSDMRNCGDNRINSRIGPINTKLARATYFKFCPMCVKEDRQCYGETYWHRIHQIHGVEVCSHHAVFLEASQALINNKRNPLEAISAESSIYVTLPRPLNLSSSFDDLLLKIARGVAWLLKWRGEPLSGETLRARYNNALLRRGLAYYNGKVRRSEFIGKFIEHCSQQALRTLGCDIKKGRDNSTWLTCLLYSSKRENLRHPLRHILLMDFLGYTPEQFFTSFKNYKPFGDGPWPCLNHSADHYRQLTIKECRVSGSKRGRKPIGTFGCPCGFTYTRTGPDRTKEDLLKASSVRSYGAVWEATLERLWQDDSITIRHAAATLGVSALTVKRRAIYLGLQYPRNTFGSSRANQKVNDRYIIVSSSVREERQRRRQEWLKVRTSHPKAHRSELIVIAPGLISWLRKNDSGWLEANIPPRKITPRPVALVDWVNIDVKLATEVNAAALKVRHVTDPPVRVSLEAIINEIGQRYRLQSRLSHLPLTKTTLDKYLESHEDFLIRKIAWAAELFRKEGIKPTPTRLKDRASARSSSASKSDRVRQALDVALTTLI